MTTMLMLTNDDDDHDDNADADADGWITTWRIPCQKSCSKTSATKETKDFLYILTKLDEGVGLIKLKKDSGEKVAELILKDKKPEYEVDDLFGILYFKKDKKQIVSYDLR
jgi:hypothetical protein